MISFRPLFRPSQAYFILFASFALATLQNVTVDDAVSVGPLVPYYLPNNSVWAAGNTCTTCRARPDPSQVYNRTWHDITYSPLNDFSPAINISFTGSGLYIFFIIANTVAGTTTLTDLYFLLDNVNVSSYIQIPDSTSDYQYNVPVYANGDLEFGPHTMMVEPVLAGNAVLMLFDYFIYSTTNASIDNSTSTPSSSESSSSSQGTSSGPHISAIVGSTVGGVVFLLLAVSLSYYWIYKRRHGGRPSLDESIPLVAPINFASPSPGNNILVNSSTPARSPSPDFATTMKEIDERSKQLFRSDLGKRSLEHIPSG